MAPSVIPSSMVHGFLWNENGHRTSKQDIFQLRNVPETENLVLVCQVSGIRSGAEVEGLDRASVGAEVVLGATRRWQVRIGARYLGYL